MKFFKFSVLFVFFFIAFSVKANALPTAPDGFTFIDSPFWSFTDYTTANSQFTLVFEDASYESDFGLFTVDNILNPTSFVQHFQIFSYTDEPSNTWFPTQKTVTLRNLADQWQVTLDNTTWMDFDKTFGFYFGVHTNPKSDNVDYYLYSYSLFNPGQLDHILTAYNELTKQVIIYLDDQRGGGDRDFNDMIVMGNDLAPAPVPEPGTLLLLGSGLIGVAAYGWRRRNSK